MKHLVTFVFCFVAIAVNAQMESDGDNPKAIYKKFPYEFQFTTSVAFADGDLGWEDDYLNAFMVDHTGRMWIAGNHGLSYSDDKGLHWSLSITRYATFAIFETRKHTLLSSSTNEFLLRSDNHGLTWKDQKVKDVGTGRSSHGERYDDVFYVQVDDKRIIRTCQYNALLLISDDDGLTWSTTKLPDTPESIVNLGDTVLVMFTYDEMYASTDRGKTWNLQSKGLPVKRDPEAGQHNGVIDCGVATNDGTIMALVESQEEDVYNHTAYFYNLKTGIWTIDPARRIYEWSQSQLFDGGKGRILVYDYSTFELSASLDKGKTWGVMYKAEHQYAGPHAICPDGNNVYFFSYTSVSVMHFPEVCSETKLPGVYQTYHPDGEGNDKIEFFPVKPVVDTETPFSVYQLCSDSGKGYSRFLVHVPHDTDLIEVNILHRDRGTIAIEQSFTTVVSLGAGDYELWYYNVDYHGCYFLNVVPKNGTMEQQTGTTCIFY